jgi:hypothetical protein
MFYGEGSIVASALRDVFVAMHHSAPARVGLGCLLAFATLDGVTTASTAMPLGRIDASGGMSFLVLLPRLVRPFGFLANSAEDRMLLALVEKSAPVLGGIVLGAKDLADLDGRFDEALDRPEFSEFLAGIAKVVPFLASRLGDSALPVEIVSLASVLGDGLRAKLREGDVIIAEFVRCFGRVAPGYTHHSTRCWKSAAS